MNMKNRFDERYKSGDLPWDIKRPDANLINTLNEFNIQTGHALDIGCGTGDNVFWLTENGFNATGIDISPNAIQLAQKKAESRLAKPAFYVADILNDTIPEAPYDFIFDRGCFHTFGSQEERSRFAGNVFKTLKNKGMWLSLVGNVDDGRLELGPPKRTALEVVMAVESYFEILSLRQGWFDSNDKAPSKIWICVMQKRDK
jgi:SAM-dependent methyltransferase